MMGYLSGNERMKSCLLRNIDKNERHYGKQNKPEAQELHAHLWESLYQGGMEKVVDKAWEVLPG